MLRGLQQPSGLLPDVTEFVRLCSAIPKRGLNKSVLLISDGDEAANYIFAA